MIMSEQVEKIMLISRAVYGRKMAKKRHTVKLHAPVATGR
jgi:hypothetical protein